MQFACVRISKQNIQHDNNVTTHHAKLYVAGKPVQQVRISNEARREYHYYHITGQRRC